MKTKFEEIVSISEIGRTDIPVLTGELFRMAESERISQSGESAKVLLLAIDVQNSFMEGGSLGVPGSRADVGRLCRFIYERAGQLSDILVSLDSHDPMQIFSPIWWTDANGTPPQPFTTVASADIRVGKWSAERREESLNYVENIERLGKKQLTIWPYHCIKGTVGQSLESVFSNMAYFWSAARRVPIRRVFKGDDPLSEMYGIFKPEYSRAGGANTELLRSLSGWDTIFVAGEASSHCVLESVKQIAEFYEGDREITSRVRVLSDCMSPIPGFERDTELEFLALCDKYGMKLVKSTD